MSTGIISFQIHADTFDEYVHTGGVLSQEEFRWSLRAIKNTHSLDHRHPTRLQALSHVKRLALVYQISSPELISALECLYIVLRSKSTPPCSILSDQAVFIQVLLMLRCHKAATLFENQNRLSQK